MANKARVKPGKTGWSSRSSRSRTRFAALRGTRKTGTTTDALMNRLRGYDEDARDPGFKVTRK
jgi:hypothetical protein